MHELADSVRANIAEEFGQLLSELIELAKIPGIAWESFDPAELDRSAAAVAKLFEDTGVFDQVQILSSSVDGKPGAPAVVAKRKAKNSKPQILLYAHHDVQPPGDAGAWNSKPFEPIQIGTRLYGRGAADDKAGIVTHLAAIRTIKKLLGADFDLGISIFIEGEEEAGSPTFRNFLEENQELLAADVIVVADSGNWTTEVPALTTTLRGLVSQVIEVSTLDHALHSGMYGGAVPDAMLATIKLLATLHDDAGNVAIDGLISASAQELPYSDEDLARDAGLLPGVAPIGDGTIVERIWVKPSLTVIGIDGQSVALSSNTLLPSVKSKLSLRIAPGQDPEEALALMRKHLEKHLPFGAKLKYLETELGKPYAAPVAGWARGAAEQSLTTAFGVPSVNMGIGGSIPFIADLTEVFPNAQILVTGVEDPDSRAHSPNESVDLDMLKKAMVAEALMLLHGNAISAS